MPKTEEGRPLTNAALWLSCCSLLSPLAGMLVEMTLAWRFGASSVVDAFRIAYLLVGFGSSLFLVQILPHVLIPLFAAYRAERSELEAWRYSLSFGALLGALSLVFSAWLWRYPSALTDFLGPGLSAAAKSHAHRLVQYFGWAFALMVWSGVINGILHSYRVFTVLPWCQLAANLVLVLTIALAGKLESSASIGVGILLGAILTVLVHAGCLVMIFPRSSLRLAAVLAWVPGRELARGLRLAAPLVLMLLVQQWTVVVYNRAFSLLALGTVAEVGYAWKLLMLVGTAPAALAIVLFPALSDAAARQDAGETARLLDRLLKTTLFLTVPVLPLLFAFRLEVAQLFFARGTMRGGDVYAVAELFGLFLLAAPSGPVATVLMKFFYARQQAAIPLLASSVAAAMATVVAPWAAQWDGARGVALASNLTNWVTALGLMLAAWWRRAVDVSALTGYGSRLMVVTGGVAVAAYLSRSVALATPMPRSVMVALATASSLAICYVLARLVSVREADELYQYARWRCARLLGKPPLQTESL